MSEFHEPLERRLFLSASVKAGVLRVNGTGGNDEILVSRSGSSINVDINGSSQSFPARGIKSVRIKGFEGDDSLRGKGPISTNILAGAGNDSVFGGNASDTLSGGSGDDLLNGNGGSDSIEGGDGRDNLTGGAGDDLLNGDAGHDSIRGGKGTDLSIDTEDRLLDPDRADQNLNLLFARFPSVFNDLFPNGTGGTGNINDIFGNGGNDIFGGGGGSIFD
jgi:Ca2+-binding RTX toxin-like protein